jgi:hypothetical protein
MKKYMLLCIVAWLLGLAITSTASAAQPRVAVGNASHLTRGASLQGAVARSHRMRVTIGLASRDPLGLKAFSQAVTTPGSAEYGRFLTVGQFARRYGARSAAMARVRRALRADGLSVVKTYANGLSIIVAGNAATLEHAFATRLAQVRTADGRRTVVNTTTPTLPASFGHDVQAVLGLNGLADPSPVGLAGHRALRGAHRASTDARAHVATGGPQPCAAATAAAAPLPSGQSAVPYFGYTADMMAAAYGVQALYAEGDFGQGQTVAVYEQESLNPADIATYQSCYGTNAAVTIRNVDTPDPVDTGGDGDGEASLDVEQIIGMAPQASVIVYAASQSDINGEGELLSAIASQDAAKVVSISYGVCEAEIGQAGAQYEATVYQEMAAQGQSVFASSGDQGSEECSPPGGDDTTSLAVADPASQPDVTAVGGTSLYSGSATSAVPWNGSNALTEGIWNSGTFQQEGQTVGAATTGGLSSLWTMPAFQSSAAAALGVVNSFTPTGSCGASACREVPDVSADGDPSTAPVIYADPNADGTGGSSWLTYGGTSAAAPLWAGFAALTNVQSNCRGLSVGDINPSLYALAGANYAGYFRDVTAPSAFTAATSNDTTGAHPGIYPVTAGYDLATGLGTPLMQNLAPALCALRAPVYTVSVANPGTVRALIGAKASLQITGADSGGAALAYSASGLPAGLAIGATTGTITGTPTKTGRYAVTVAAEDFASNAASMQFTLVVVQPSARFGRVSLTGITKRRARLKFSVTRPHGRKLRSVTLHLSKTSGLSFGRLRRHVSVTTDGGRHHRAIAFRLRERHGSVTIRFRQPQTKVLVEFGRGAIRVSGKLARRARRHGARVPVGLSATDTRRHTSRRTLRVRVRATVHHKRSHHHKHHHKRKHHAKLSSVSSQWSDLDYYVAQHADELVFGYGEAPKFLSDRINYATAVFSPISLNDWSSWELKQ